MATLSFCSINGTYFPVLTKMEIIKKPGIKFLA